MKKLLILLLAAGLFTSCNNNKGKNDRTDRDTTKTSKDDYNSGDKSSDKDKDKDNTDQNKDNNGNTDNNNSRGSWSSVEVDAFITNCVSSAVNGGMQRTKADSYCNCMQRKLETLYPNVNDAGSLTEEDMNSPSMQRLVKDCLF